MILLFAEFMFNLRIEVVPSSWAYGQLYHYIFVKLSFDVLEAQLHCLASFYKSTSLIN